MTTIQPRDNRPQAVPQAPPTDKADAAQKTSETQGTTAAKPATPPAAPPATDSFAAADPATTSSSKLGTAMPAPKGDRSRLRSKALGATAPKTESKPADAEAMAARLASAEAPLAAAPTQTAPGKVPENPQDLKKIYSELKDKSPEDLQKVHKDLLAVRDGDAGQKLLAMARLGAAFPETLKGALNAVGIKGGVVDKILDKPAILKNAATMLDGSKGSLDRISATLGFAKDVTGIIPKDQLPKIVQDLKPALPVAKELTGLVKTFSDDKSSALDKAGSVISFLKAAKDAVPADKLPQLAEKLKGFEGPLAVAENALVLLDPEKSLAEKAGAAAKIWANIPDTIKAGKDLGKWLGELGVPKAADIAKAAVPTPTPGPAPAGLSDDLKKAIPPGVASKLQPADIEKLNKLAGTEGLKENLGKVLKNVNDPAQVQSLIKGLEGASGPTQKAMLEGLAGMEKKSLQKLMTETVEGKPALEVMQKVLSHVPESMVGDAAKLFSKVDAEAATVLLKLGAKADGKVIGELLGQAGKVAGEVDGKVLSQGLKTLDKLAVALAEKGVKIGAEAAEKLLKGLGKMIPAIGAIPSFIDAAAMGKIALETNSPQIRYLAGMGAALNTVDGALGVAEAFGVGNVAMPVQLALGVAEIGLDLYVGHLREQEKAGTFKPTPELNAAIGATALATIPTGPQMLIASFGIPGSIEVLADTVKVGGELGIKAQKELMKLQGAGVEQQMKMTADAINTMADMVRNPEKYGKAAEQMARQGVENLKRMADQAGEVGEKALKALGDVAEDLKKKGEKGVETLKWIANNPGKAADVAQKALGDMAEKGLTALDDAQKAVGKKALEALNEAAKTYQGAKAQVEKTVGEIAKKGEQAIDTLKWAAQNPGVVADAAKKELVDLALKGGEAAKKAYDTLVDLGDQGKKAIEDLTKKAISAGEKGVEALQWVAKNPGKAGNLAVQAAVDGLKKVGEGTEKAAKAARDALVKLADDTGEAGKKAVNALADIVKGGGAAAEEVLNAWKGNVTRGGKAVIDALGNLGDAGAEALAKIANKGGELAKSAFESIWKTSGWGQTQKFLENAGGAAADAFVGWVASNKGIGEVVDMAEKVGSTAAKKVGSWMLDNLGTVASAGADAVGKVAGFLWDNASALGQSVGDLATRFAEQGGAFAKWAALKAANKLNPLNWFD